MRENNSTKAINLNVGTVVGDEFGCATRTLNGLGWLHNAKPRANYWVQAKLDSGEWTVLAD